MGLFIRVVSAHADNTLIVFSRNLAGVVLLTPTMLIRNGPASLKTSRPLLHLGRALSGLAAMYGFFYALAHIPLANAMVFTYSAPVFIPLIAWLALDEQIDGRIITATLLGLIGVLLVCKPHAAWFNLMSLCGTASALLAAIAFVSVRALTATESPQRIVLYFAVISTLLSFIPYRLSHPHGQHLQSHTILLLGGIGTLATLSQLCLSKAYSLAPASRIAPINYLAIIISGIYAWVLWGETPDMAALAGAVLIFLATYLCLGKAPAKQLP